MAKKQDPVVALSEEMQRLFSDPIGNFDAIAESIRVRQDSLVGMRDEIQAHLEWLTALYVALQANRIKHLQQKVYEGK